MSIIKSNFNDMKGVNITHFESFVKLIIDTCLYIYKECFFYCKFVAGFSGRKHHRFIDTDTMKRLGLDVEHHHHHNHHKHHNVESFIEGRRGGHHSPHSKHSHHNKHHNHHHKHHNHHHNHHNHHHKHHHHHHKHIITTIIFI